MFVENLVNVEEMPVDLDNVDDEDEEMEQDQPVQKKSKQ